MLFDVPHVMFMVRGFALLALLEVLFFLFVKNEKKRVIILRCAAIITVMIHDSSLYVD